MPRTASIVPTSYDEMFRHYYPYVCKLVRRFGVPDDLHEDVSMILVTKFIEKNMLEQFDPERVGADGMPVQFASFLSGFVVAYVRHYVTRARVEYDRERTYVDQTDNSNGRADTPERQSWLDRKGFRHEDDVSKVEYELLLVSIRKHLGSLSVRGKKNFLLLFDLVVYQLEERGRTHIRELAGLFEVSEPAVSNWLKELAVHVRKVQG